MTDNIITFPDNQTCKTTKTEKGYTYNISKFDEICGTLATEQDVADYVAYMKKKKILENHNHAITISTRDGKTVYRTYVDDKTKKSGRRQIEATTRENLDKKIIVHYNMAHKSKGHVFEDVYKDWLFTSKQNKVSGGTIQRINNDYLRFYKSHEISQKAVESLTCDYCEKFLNKTIKDYGLTRKALNNMKTILINVVRYSIKNKYISENPLDDVDLDNTFIQRPRKRNDDEEVFNYEEIAQLESFILDDVKNFTDTAPYAILLSFQLGLRVGELICLKWEDISDTKIHVQRMVRTYNTINPETLKPTDERITEVLPFTKTPAGDRIIHLTPKAIEYLKCIKEMNEKNGFSQGEFIFYQKTGERMNRQRINTVLYGYCDKINITKKSSHKLRKTFISNLIENGFNPSVIIRIVGHEDYHTTLNSYCRGLKSEKEIEDKMDMCCL